MFYGEGFFKYIAPPKPDPNYDLFMYFGWADPALNPMMGVEYYQKVTERMGPATTDFFRLFMVPGMLHCGDGPGPDQFDSLGALSKWKGSGSTDDAANFTCVKP
jgi:hypothetical protein